ncbi:hypothetical protein IFM89_035874 [Coptis chinensis]|uniref:Alpha/beta hydrolase fold-3 domain-containing protein n=1 Tax=Coptis chinensis TaxID=261450 RepID=A0A835H0X8_9MAGN|nr:hypothetical protein IFM89_035874 [Coptis chinensis]
MASTPADVLWEYDPFIRTFKDGRRLRIRPDVFTRPTCVNSKDILITPEHSAVTIEDSNVFCQESVLSGRLYLPKGANIYSKLPLLIYFHGGGFCIEFAFCATYHNYLNYLVEKANVVAVSVNYRRASNSLYLLLLKIHGLLDSMGILQEQPKEFSPPQEEWLRDYANFDKVYMAGDSAGATITHNMAVRAGSDPKFNGKFSGILVVHPYFLSFQPIPGEGSEMDDMLKLWFAIQTTIIGCEDPNLDDPLVNPITDRSKLFEVGTQKVMAESNLNLSRKGREFTTTFSSGCKREVTIRIGSRKLSHFSGSLRADGSHMTMSHKRTGSAFVIGLKQTSSRRRVEAAERQAEEYEKQAQELTTRLHENEDKVEELQNWKAASEAKLNFLMAHIGANFFVGNPIIEKQTQRRGITRFYETSTALSAIPP